MGLWNINCPQPQALPSGSGRLYSIIPRWPWYHYPVQLSECTERYWYHRETPSLTTSWKISWVHGGRQASHDWRTVTSTIKFLLTKVL